MHFLMTLSTVIIISYGETEALYYSNSVHVHFQARGRANS